MVDVLHEKSLLAESEVEVYRCENLELKRGLENQTDEIGNWKRRMNKIEANYDRFMAIYENMKNSHEGLNIIIDNHKDEIEKKAVFIQKLQTRLVLVMGQLES